MVVRGRSGIGRGGSPRTLALAFFEPHCFTSSLVILLSFDFKDPLSEEVSKFITSSSKLPLSCSLLYSLFLPNTLPLSIHLQVHCLSNFYLFSELLDIIN